MASKRRLARIAAMQSLFEHIARETDASAALTKNLEELKKDGEPDQELAETIVAGVLEHRNALRESIEKAAPEWSWKRMDAISRCILLVGAYELLHCRDVPAAVVMNEAIEIAKEYGTEESKKFVNGVLNALAHEK